VSVLEERVDVIEERVDTLEAIFGHFMARTGVVIQRLERSDAEFKSQAEADRTRMDATIARIDETLARMEQSDADFGARLEQSNAEFKSRLDESNARMDKSQADMNKKWGELALKFGTVVEDIVAPNLPTVAKKYFGVTEIEDFMIRRKVRNKQDRSKRREFDAIVVGEHSVIINETKVDPRVEYINQFLAALKEIPAYFPEYEGKTIIPVVSSLSMGEDIVNYLSRNKVYAMVMKGDTMEIVNFEQVSGQRPGEE
jgi:hypothetical protein